MRYENLSMHPTSRRRVLWDAIAAAVKYFSLKKMKNKLFALAAVVVLQGCWVSQKSYKTQNEIQKKESIFSKDSLNVSCTLTRDDDKNLNLEIWFDKIVKQEIIKNISIIIRSADGQDISFDYVRMIPLSEGSTAQFEKAFKKNHFSDLPEKHRFTVIGKESVFYEFNFRSVKKIHSKKINISIEVELPDRTISIKDDFFLQKRCYFTVH
jgi:hypothetical protein